VLGVLLLSENITMTTLAGIALVLAGVTLTRRKRAGDEARASRPLALNLS
jgi:drug/metabolite transporter (DMT)-like permease